MNQKSLKNQSLIFLGILLLNIPLFFDIYRTAAFNIVPHDDYVPYLLYILGEKGSIPTSPTGYRFFSVLIALPVYYIIPLFKFSLLEGKSDVYFKALEALSFVTYLSVSFTSFLMYKISRHQLGGNEVGSILASLITLLLFRFTAIYGVDPTAILLISLLLYNIEKKVIFTILLLVSIGFNEKIIFLFLMLFLARIIINQRENYFYIGISSFTFFCYFVIRYYVDLPGYEYMMEPDSYLGKAREALSILFTAKSMYLNFFPGVLALSLFFAAKKENDIRGNDKGLIFSKVDFVPLVGFSIIALIMNLQYTMGRILLFCFPLYLPLATLYLTRLLNNKN